MKRWMYRCRLCLSVFSINDVKLPPSAKCGVCDHPLHELGRVEGSRLKIDTKLVPCDSRCTNAEGPNCDCVCNGKNHGSAALVDVTLDAGSAPRVTPIKADIALQRAAEVRQAVEAATARIVAIAGDVCERKAAGEYLSGAGFNLFLRARKLYDELRAAKYCQRHSLRMKKLAAVAATP